MTTMLLPPDAPASRSALPTSPAGGTRFPYTDLATALKVAAALHTTPTHAASFSRLASLLGVSETTARIYAFNAAQFGLVDVASGTATLTSLGEQHDSPAAQRAAFLNPPIFRTLYERYVGRVLPPKNRLDRDLAALGVPPQQTTRARRHFLHSATTTGLLHRGSLSDLPPPPPRAATAEPPAPHVEPEEERPRFGRPQEHPAFQALLALMPPLHADWSPEERDRWLHSAATILDLLYGNAAEPRH